MRPIAIIAQHLSDPPPNGLARSLCDAGFDVWVVPNLYHAGEDSWLWSELKKLEGPMAFVMPLHPRPIEALLRRHGVWNAESLAIDSRQVDSEVAAELCSRLKPPPGQGPMRSFDEIITERWYPLVDESRCTHCGSCFQFCLFGVYVIDAEKKVRIANPDKCKAGCPACSRICPQGALMFPLYEKDPAIAGAPGQFPKPDAAARKMYYSRTGQACPKCGRAGKPATKPGARACEECGRPIDSAESDALDALIDGLERIEERRS